MPLSSTTMPSSKRQSQRSQHAPNRLSSRFGGRQQVKPVFVSELCQMGRGIWVTQLDLQGHVDAHRCCGKSLMGSALVRVGVGQCAPPESISKRAPSTTLTFFRFRINGLRTTDTAVSRKSVRPLNLAQSVTAHSSIRRQAKDSLIRGMGIQMALGWKHEDDHRYSRK